MQAGKLTEIAVGIDPEFDSATFDSDAYGEASWRASSSTPSTASTPSGAPTSSPPSSRLRTDRAEPHGDRSPNATFSEALDNEICFHDR